MRSDEDRWHGSAEALARKIDNALIEMREMLGMADEILQADEMPEPWDQWERAVECVQSAWSETTDAGEFHHNVRQATRALRKAGIADWPPEAK